MSMITNRIWNRGEIRLLPPVQCNNAETKLNEMNRKLKFLWVTLNQFIIYEDEPQVVNAIKAIGSRDKELLVIRPEYHTLTEQCADLAASSSGIPAFTVTYGDAFHIDTWDNKIASFN